MQRLAYTLFLYSVTFFFLFTTRILLGYACLSISSSRDARLSASKVARDRRRMLLVLHPSCSSTFWQIHGTR